MEVDMGAARSRFNDVRMTLDVMLGTCDIEVDYQDILAAKVHQVCLEEIGC